jgi:hypothetical protein
VAWKEAIMQHIRLRLLATVVLALVAVSAAAQQIRFLPDFTDATGLQLNDSQIASYNEANVLRLTPPWKVLQAASTAYYKVPQPVTAGFSTYFVFQMHGPTMCCAPGDGFSFILQNSNATDDTQGAWGRGLTAMGSAVGGLGYSGINDSLAIEFDILGNAWDPNGNHIAIQTCGGDPSKFNSPVHAPGTYTIGNNRTVTSCLLSADAINSNLPSTLGPTCNGESCTDGPMHQVVIEYTPPAGEQQGSLQVYLDPQFQPGTHTPVAGAPTIVNVPYDITYSPSNPLGLQPANVNSLYVGFTASVENGGTTTDIRGWEFTTHAPSQITQPISDGGTLTNFPFGGHQFGVTYPSDFMNNCQANGDCIYMTVTATPVNQQTFYAQRLQGTPFADENCIIYLETGGNCVVYTVTCQDQNGHQVLCPTEQEDNIAICSQFETSEPVAAMGTDYLKADPIGSNNWCSIWTGFMQQDPPDPIVSGKGQGFSDLVVTLTPIRLGPSCGGDLNTVTKALAKTTSVKPKAGPGQGNNFCPPIN